MVFPPVVVLCKCWSGMWDGDGFVVGLCLEGGGGLRKKQTRNQGEGGKMKKRGSWVERRWEGSLLLAFVLCPGMFKTSLHNIYFCSNTSSTEHVRGETTGLLRALSDGGVFFWDRYWLLLFFCIFFSVACLVHFTALYLSFLFLTNMKLCGLVFGGCVGEDRVGTG